MYGDLQAGSLLRQDITGGKVFQALRNENVHCECFFHSSFGDGDITSRSHRCQQFEIASYVLLGDLLCDQVLPAYICCT